MNQQSQNIAWNQEDTFSLLRPITKKQP